MARGDEDELSPTTIILNSLRAKGLPPNAENIRRAVAQMGRQPDEAGPDPVAGLRVQRTDDNVDQGGGSVAGKVEGGGQSGNAGNAQRLPTPPVPPQGGPSGADSGSKTTSAQPAPATSYPPADSLMGADLDPNIGTAILGGAGLGGLGYGLYRAGQGRGTPGVGGAPNMDVGGQEFMGNMPMSATGRVMDVPGTTLSGPGSRGSIGVDLNAAPGAEPALTGPGMGPTNLEMQMQKALMSGGGAPELGSGAPIDIPPYVSDPSSIINAGRNLPPGVTDIDAARAGGGTDFTRNPVQERVGVPEVPFRNAGPTPYIDFPSRVGRAVRGIAGAAKPLLGVR